ncbi:hypothetical protein ENBRE01_1576 [Enteropsectra breve]|nr:hypothetical protein ENBRE01_1576 [Enteropsectra breve]
MKLSEKLFVGLTALCTVLGLSYGIYQIIKKNSQPENTPKTQTTIQSQTQATIPPQTQEAMQPHTQKIILPETQSQIPQITMQPETQSPPSMTESPVNPVNEHISLELVKKRRVVLDLLSDYSSEPLKTMPFDEYKKLYDDIWPLALCGCLLLNSSTLKSFLSENQFNSDEQPFLSSFKCAFESGNLKEIAKEKYEEFHCHPRDFSNLSDMLQFIIEKLSAEDKRVEKMLCNTVYIKSPSNTVLKTFKSKTINFNETMAEEMLNGATVEQACDCYLRDDARVQNYLSSKATSSNYFFNFVTKYNDAIIVTTDRGMSSMRDKVQIRQSELKFANDGQGETTYKLKYMVIGGLKDELHKLLRFNVADLDVFDEETKEKWIRKCLTNAILLLYERQTA